MSFEPDTNDIRVRQLGEEIKRIREEQFAKAFPIGLGGGSSPVGGDAVTGGSSTGTFSWLPNMVRVTRDTGVVERLAFKNKNPVKDFSIGDIVTGDTSGATGEVGDIDVTGTDTGFLIFVPGTTSGTFVDNEFLDTVSDNNVARADLTIANPVGRGHLNAGSASIIAEATSSPAEIHFIDTASQNGQLALMRAQNGQTIRIRRAVTNDGNTGNLDLDQSFDITENALVLFQFQAQSNVTPDGGWVPLITDVTTTTTGGGGGINFPILYPQTNLGSVGLQTVALNLNNPNGHYQLMTLTGDISFAFVNETSIGEGFKFYTVLQQDAVGGHKLISIPPSVKNSGALLTQVDLAPLAQTLFQFTTADGGVTYHAQLVDPTSSGQNQTPWLSPIDADTFDLFNIDKLIFFGAGGFSFPTDATLQAISTSGTGLQFNVGISQTYRFFKGGIEAVQIGNPSTGNPDTLFFDNTLLDVGAIFFTDGVSFTASISSIPGLSELQYNVGGAGAHHSFFANNITGNASFEIREFVNKSNVNFDLVTNNIINVDQILFHDLQGFNNATDHAERRLTGGFTGINMNLPQGTVFPSEFAIWFENLAKTKSNVIYKFQENALIMGKVGDCTLSPIVTGAVAYQLCRGGGLFDFGSRMTLQTSADSGTFPVEQILELNVAGTTKMTMVNTIDGIQVFDDIGMNTFNIFDLDVLRYAVDSGVIGFGEYGSAVESDGSRLKWSVPPTRGYEWQIDLEKIVDLTAGVFRMNRNSQVTNPIIETDGSFILSDVHTQGTVGQIDGEHRLVDDLAGSFDVIFGTGGDLVNLSDLVGVGEGANRKLSNLEVGLVAVNTDLDPENNGLENLGSATKSWNDLNIDRIIFRHNNGVVCNVPSIGRSSNALRLNSPLGNGITLEENCVPLYDFGVNPVPGLTLKNGALFVRIQGVSTLHSITNLGSSMQFSNDANIFGRSFDFGDITQKGERINLFGSGGGLTEFRFKTDNFDLLTDVGRIVFEGENLGGQEVDYGRLDFAVLSNIQSEECGLSNWKVAENGNQNSSFIQLDGCGPEIRMRKPTNFVDTVEFNSDVFLDGNNFFLDANRDSKFSSPVDDVLILDLGGNPEYIWTTLSYDIGDKFFQIAESASPLTPGTDSARIFLDTADGILKVKKDGGSEISLEAGGGGQNQTPWLSNIDGNGFSLIDASEIINLRRLFLFDSGSSGSGRIVFDTNGDNDTWIGTHSSADSILITINGGNAMRWNPVDGLKLGSTGAGNKFFLDVVKNYIRFDSEDPSQIPTPAQTEVHMWFNQVTDELSVKKEDGSIVSLELGGGSLINRDLIPDIDCTYDIGSPSFRFKDAFFCGSIRVDVQGSFGGLRTDAITGFARIGGNMVVDGDFSTRGLETILGNGLNDNIRVLGQIRTDLFFGPSNQFATGPVEGISRVGNVNPESVFLRSLHAGFPDFDLPASPNGPIIHCSISVTDRAGYYTRPLGLALGAPNGTAGTIQLPQNEIGFVGNSTLADERFHGDGGCIAIENTNRFPNVDPRIVVRDNLGNWYEIPMTLVYPVIPPPP